MQVLILNADYRPLRRTVSARRAVALLQKGRAEVVEAGAEVIRTPSTAIVVPTVIRLKEYKRVPDPRRPAWTKAGVITRDDCTCQYCGVKLKRTEATVDHVIPASRFKTVREASTWGNTVCACRPCNQRKANKMPHEAGLRLRSEPKPPRVNLFVISGDIPAAWKKYIVTGRSA